jgi:hypothetical protein
VTWHLQDFARRDLQKVSGGDLADILETVARIREAVKAEQERRRREPSRWKECPECSGMFVHLQTHRWWTHGQDSPPPPEPYRKLRTEIRKRSGTLLDDSAATGFFGSVISMMAPGSFRHALERWLDRYSTAALTDDERRKLAEVAREITDELGVADLGAATPESRALWGADASDVVALLTVITGEAFDIPIANEEGDMTQ